MVNAKAPKKDHPVVSWPPKLISLTPLGYMRDESGNSYPRDIGRSSVFSDGSVVVQFGDTFSHDSRGSFTGLTDNTCAIVLNPKTNPTMLSYTSTNTQFNPDGNEPVPEFINPYHSSEDSEEWQQIFFPPSSAIPSGVQRKFWSFSGIVEIERVDDMISGWVWYDKREITPRDIEGYVYTGVGKVKYWPNTGRIHAALEPGHRLFEKDEPKIGAFCAVRDGEQVFVYGHMPNTKDVTLGRVQPDLAGKRSAYQYLTHYEPNASGSDLLEAIVWSNNIKACLPVQGLENMQHGQIYKTEMYPSSFESPWAFVGCNATGDSQVIVGRSRTPEGPFTTVQLLVADPLINMPPGSFSYCIYPHPWASDNRKGDLMISWSEGSMNGNVIAVVARMKTVQDGEENAAIAVQRLAQFLGEPLVIETLENITLTKVETRTPAKVAEQLEAIAEIAD